MARILVVDDEEHIRYVLQRFLEFDGHDVNVASTGQDAVNMFDEDDIDLLITDIMMPDMNGLEIIEEVRKNSPRVKIIAISGGGISMGPAPEDLLEKASAIGAHSILSKPFSRAALASAVHGLLA